MNPDDIKKLIAREYSMLTSAKRHSPSGWSFFYGEGRKGNRIIVAQERPNGGSYFLRAQTQGSRSQRGGAGREVFTGGPEALREIIDEEIRLYTGSAMLPVRQSIMLADEDCVSDNTDIDKMYISEESESGYTPQIGDTRRIVERQIRERRGQLAFRNALRQRYGDRCQVSGSELLAVLEAAHIIPHRGEADNNAENGLLLRSDIHTLFDLDLLGIEPTTLRIELHPHVKSEYGQFANVAIKCRGSYRPSQVALQQRYEQFRQRLTSELPN